MDSQSGEGSTPDGTVSAATPLGAGQVAKAAAPAPPAPKPSGAVLESEPEAAVNKMRRRKNYRFPAKQISRR